MITFNYWLGKRYLITDDYGVLTKKTTTPAMVRLDEYQSVRVESLTTKSGETVSGVIRAAVRYALPNFENEPSLVRQLNAGLVAESIANKSIPIADELQASVKKIAAYYGKSEIETLTDAIKLGLPAVAARASAYGALDQDGKSVPTEEAERIIEMRHDAHPLWVELMRVGALLRSAKQTLVRVTSHPDGAKAYAEICAQAEELRKSGAFVSFPKGWHISDELKDVPSLKKVLAPIDSSKPTAKKKPKTGK